MILSQLAPHRLAAIIPEPLRQLRLPEECGHAPEEGCSCAEEQAAAEAAAGMREVASLQVGHHAQRRACEVVHPHKGRRVDA
jgi:hypothetical protein